MLAGDVPGGIGLCATGIALPLFGCSCRVVVSPSGEASDVICRIDVAEGIVPCATGVALPLFGWSSRASFVSGFVSIRSPSAEAEVVESPPSS